METSARPWNVWVRGNTDSPLEGKWGGSFKDNSDSASIVSGMLSCDYSDWSNTFWSCVLVISQTPNHIASVWPHVVSVSTGYWGQTLKERLHSTECFTIAMSFCHLFFKQQFHWMIYLFFAKDTICLIEPSWYVIFVLNSFNVFL